MKRGIAMSTLLVIIIAMIILLSVATVSTVNISNTSKKLAFASELQMIQESVDSYRTKNDGAYPVSDFVNIDISSLDEATKLQFINNNEDIVNNNLSFRKLDLTKLSLVSITRGKTENNDIYVVSEKTGIVYYAKGEIIGSNTYYSMTQELKKLLNYNKKSDEVLTDNAVIFDNALNYLKHANPILKEIILPFSIFRIGKSALDKSALKTFIYLFNDQLNKNKHVQKEKWIELYKSFLEDFARFDEKYDCYLKKFIDEYYPVLHRDTLST